MNYELFIDLDGVMANFKKGAERALLVVHGQQIEHCEQLYEADENFRALMWTTVETYQNDHNRELWYELELLEDAMDLWNYVRHLEPQILSATGNPSYNAADQKRRWVAEKFGDHVVVNLTRKAREKAQHAAPHRILIDDKEKAIGPWREAGGIGILHTSAKETIRGLMSIGL